MLTVEVNGRTYTSDVDVVLDEQNRWSLAIPAQHHLDNGTYDVVSIITDPAGNISTDATLDELIIDRLAPSLTFSPVTGDDMLNSADLQSALSVGGSSDAENGSLLELSVSNNNYTGAVIDGVWQIVLPLLDVQSFEFPSHLRRSSQ